MCGSARRAHATGASPNAARRGARRRFAQKAPVRRRSLSTPDGVSLSLSLSLSSFFNLVPHFLDPTPTPGPPPLDPPTSSARLGRPIGLSAKQQFDEVLDDSLAVESVPDVPVGLRRQGGLVFIFFFRMLLSFVKKKQTNKKKRQQQQQKKSSHGNLCTTSTPGAGPSSVASASLCVFVCVCVCVCVSISNSNNAEYTFSRYGIQSNSRCYTSIPIHPTPPPHRKKKTKHGLQGQDGVVVLLAVAVVMAAVVVVVD